MSIIGGQTARNIKYSKVKGHAGKRPVSHCGSQSRRSKVGQKRRLNSHILSTNLCPIHARRLTDSTTDPVRMTGAKMLAPYILYGPSEAGLLLRNFLEIHCLAMPGEAAFEKMA